MSLHFQVAVSQTALVRFFRGNVNDENPSTKVCNVNRSAEIIEDHELKISSSVSASIEHRLEVET